MKINLVFFIEWAICRVWLSNLSRRRLGRVNLAKIGLLPGKVYLKWWHFNCSWVGCRLKVWRKINCHSIEGETGKEVHSALIGCDLGDSIGQCVHLSSSYVSLSLSVHYCWVKIIDGGEFLRFGCILLADDDSICFRWNLFNSGPAFHLHRSIYNTSNFAPHFTLDQSDQLPNFFAGFLTFEQM